MPFNANLRMVAGVRRSIGVNLLAVVIPLSMSAQQADSVNYALSLPLRADSMGLTYQRPDECAWDQQWADKLYWRDRRPDTVAASKPGIPNRPSTQAQIQKCAEKFPPATVPEEQLLGVLQ